MSRLSKQKTNSNYQFYWDLTIGVGLWIAFCYIPFHIAFSSSGPEIPIAMDLALFSLYCIEAFLYRKNLSPNNLKRFFFNALPLYSLIHLGFGNWNWAVILLAIRSGDFFYRWKNISSKINHLFLPKHLNALFFFTLILSVVHILACGWLMVEPFDAKDLITAYNKAFYWAITTLTTIGYGDITPSSNISRVYTMLIELIGVGAYGLVIAQASSMIISQDARKTSQKEKRERLNSFLKYYEIPNQVQREIVDFYDHLLNQEVNSTEKEILKELPPGLQKQLITYMNIRPLSKVRLFEDCSFQCMKEVSESLEQKFYEPDETIIKAGDHGDCMYILGHGQVDVSVEDQLITNLYEGSCFGEMALLNSPMRTADVKASSYCDVFVLRKEKFDEIMKNIAIYVKT